MSTYTKILNETSLEFPSFRVIPKDQSLLMKLINVFLLVLSFGKNKAFMTSYVTTIGYTVYTCRGWDMDTEVTRCILLRHERVHMRQAAKYGVVLFSFLYLLIPLPLFCAYFRSRFEMEAYEESLRAHLEYLGRYSVEQPSVKESITDQFTSSTYGWMWPFPKAVNTWYETTLAKILGETNA